MFRIFIYCVFATSTPLHHSHQVQVNNVWICFDFCQRKPWNEENNLHHLSHTVDRLLFDSHVLRIIHDYVSREGAWHRWAHRFDCLQHPTLSWHHQSVHYVSSDSRFTHTHIRERSAENQSDDVSYPTISNSFWPEDKWLRCFIFDEHPPFVESTHPLECNICDAISLSLSHTLTCDDCLHSLALVTHKPFANKYNCFVAITIYKWIHRVQLSIFFSVDFVASCPHAHTHAHISPHHTIDMRLVVD